MGWWDDEKKSEPKYKDVKPLPNPKPGGKPVSEMIPMDIPLGKPNLEPRIKLLKGDEKKK